MPTLHIVLVEPEIPQNTGNISRTCAATGCHLHLVGPLGFSIDDRQLKRAGLDYWHLLDVTTYENLSAFFEKNTGPFFYFTTKGGRIYSEMAYPDGAYLVFGKETAGLPEELLRQNRERCVRLPMLDDEAARSLNLSNTVAVGVIKVDKPKSATSKRTVPLNRTAVEMIEDLRREAYFGENTPLVADGNGGYTKPVNLRKRFYRILKAAGIEQKGLHSLRHTFATNLVNGQKQPDGTIRVLSPRQVADLLDHSTSQITKLYYVKKDTVRLSSTLRALRCNEKDRPDKNLDGQNLRCSNQRKGKNPPGVPPLNDALLMMYQTESLQTVEADAKLTLVLSIKMR